MAGLLEANEQFVEQYEFATAPDDSRQLWQTAADLVGRSDKRGVIAALLQLHHDVRKTGETTLQTLG